MKNNRIWELDALRGLCISGMVAVHLVYDLVELYGIWNWEYPAAFTLVKDWGGVAFLLISGICATLGSRSFRRGLIVFCCGLIVTVVTYMTDPVLAITFGVLHCLGLCMVLWHFLKKFPTALLGILGVLLALIGFRFQTVRVSVPGLTWLGLTMPGYSPPDFFPMLPNLGFFLLGTVMGRTVYRKKQTLLPQANPENLLIRFFRLCGRQSLLVYLLHQPVLMGLIELTSTLLFPGRDAL